MDGLPIIRIELEGIRQRVAHMLLDRNKEMNQYILIELDKVLKEEWVVEEINTAIRDNLRQAIKGLTDDFSLQFTFRRMLSDELNKRLRAEKDDEALN